MNSRATRAKKKLSGAERPKHLRTGLKSSEKRACQSGQNHVRPNPPADRGSLERPETTALPRPTGPRWSGGQQHHWACLLTRAHKVGTQQQENQSHTAPCPRAPRTEGGGSTWPETLGGGVCTRTTVSSKAGGRPGAQLPEITRMTSTWLPEHQSEWAADKGADQSSQGKETKTSWAGSCPNECSRPSVQLLDLSQLSDLEPSHPMARAGRPPGGATPRGTETTDAAPGGKECWTPDSGRAARCGCWATAPRAEPGGDRSPGGKECWTLDAGRAARCGCWATALRAEPGGDRSPGGKECWTRDAGRAARCGCWVTQPWRLRPGGLESWPESGSKGPVAHLAVSMTPQWNLGLRATSHQVTEPTCTEAQLPALPNPVPILPSPTRPTPQGGYSKMGP